MILLLGFATLLVAEVAGVPRLPRPGVIPDYWFHVGNDLFSLGKNNDDFRTADAAGSARLFDRLVLTANYSILTNLNQALWPVEQWFERYATEFFNNRLGLPQPLYEGRIDQLTASVGWILWNARNEEQQLVHQLTAGAGIRIYDQLGGDFIQNNLHRFRAIGEVWLDYEDWQALQAVGYLSATVSQAFSVPLPKGWDPFDVGLPLGYWLEAQTLATDDGQVEGAYGAYGGIVHPLFSLWTGLRYQLRAGPSYPNPVMNAVDDNEAGWHGILGLGFGSFYLESGYNVRNGSGYGRAGVVVTADQVNIPITASGHRLAIEGQVMAPEFGMGIQTRWYPLTATDGQVLGLHPAVALHFRQSQVHHGDYGTHDLSGRQYGAGLDLELSLPEPFVRLRPYVTVGGGWRQETFQVGDDWRPFGIQAHGASSGIIYGDAGIRFYLRQPLERVHATAQVGVTAWAPFHEHSWIHGFNQVRFLRPGVDGTLGLSLDLMF